MLKKKKDITFCDTSSRLQTRPTSTLPLPKKKKFTTKGESNPRIALLRGSTLVLIIQIIKPMNFQMFGKTNWLLECQVTGSRFENLVLNSFISKC